MPSRTTTTISLDRSIPASAREDDDPDGDGRNNFLEFLRDTNPIEPHDPPRSRVHLVEVDGVRHLAWTFAPPSRLHCESEDDDSLASITGHAVDVVSASTEIGGGGRQVRLMEVIPAVVEGLPPVSPFHRYRTVRLDRPVSDATHGFIVNRIRVRESP